MLVLTSASLRNVYKLGAKGRQLARESCGEERERGKEGEGIPHTKKAHTQVHEKSLIIA